MKLRLAVLTGALMFGAPFASYADVPSLLNQYVNEDSENAVHTAPMIPQQMNLTVGTRDFWKDN
jgi:hypothetical protein